VGPGAVNQTVFSPFAGSGSVFPQFSAGTISVPEFQATSDSIGAGSAIGAQGQSVQIDFVLFNETPLVSIRLPFTYSSSHLLFDSISYAGTRGALSVSSQTQHNADSLQVLISLDYFDTAPLAPDSSSIAKAFFTISAGAPNGVIPVDTASFLSLVPLRVTTSVAAGDFTFTPLFGPGEITVDITTDVDDGGGPLLPLEFGLDQNFPNPFNPTTTIRFSLARSAHARLTVFNMLGQSVSDLVDRRLEAGEHSITFDASRGANLTLASGVYFYRLEVSGRTLTRKMALVK
ncbi:MAG: T9SS type A sorting domain-containing protein, partial [Candidatus Zixiibacteriota bacterium]